MLSVRTSRDQDGGFAWLKDRWEDRAKGGLKEKKRKRQKTWSSREGARRGGERERRADSRTNGSRLGERN